MSVHLTTIQDFLLVLWTCWLINEHYKLKETVRKLENLVSLYRKDFIEHCKGESD